jgi:hypothetical protein
MRWKLVLYVTAGVTLGVIVPRLAFGLSVGRPLLIAAAVAFVGSTLLNLVLSVRSRERRG